MDPQDVLRRRIVYQVPEMERARVRKDITYKTTDEGMLALDVYAPASGNGALPAVIFVHGDGPAEFVHNAKEWGVFVSWGQLVAASGLVGITFNHRSTHGFTRLDEVSTDVDDLLAFVRANAETLGVDASRVCMWIASAGGPFGMRVALGMAPGMAPDGIRCIVAYYTVMDVLPLRAQLPATVSDATLRACSPVAALADAAADVPPLFVARAGLDRVDLNDGLDRFIATALARNVTLDVMNHPAGHHGFDALDDDERSREIIRRTLEFMREHLLG